MLTQEEIRVAADRAEVYPKQANRRRWGQGYPYDVLNEAAFNILRENPALLEAG